VGSRVGLTTVRAPGEPQYAAPVPARAFALSRDGRTLTVRFSELPARCRPIDHVDLVARPRWIIVQVMVVVAESPRCDASSSVPRSVQLELPSPLRGRPILTQQPVFPRTDVIAPFPISWGGYLSPDHRTAVIGFVYGVCGVLAGVEATVTGGVAHVTVYEGATQTFLPCIDIGFSGETYVRLTRPARALADAVPPLPFATPTGADAP
jgi:hypothetical protein